MISLSNPGIVTLSAAYRMGTLRDAQLAAEQTAGTSLYLAFGNSLSTVYRTGFDEKKREIANRKTIYVDNNWLCLMIQCHIPAAHNLVGGNKCRSFLG